MIKLALLSWILFCWKKRSFHLTRDKYYLRVAITMEPVDSIDPLRVTLPWAAQEILRLLSNEFNNLLSGQMFILLSWWIFIAPRSFDLCLSLSSLFHLLHGDSFAGDRFSFQPEIRVKRHSPWLTVITQSPVNSNERVVQYSMNTIAVLCVPLRLLFFLLPHLLSLLASLSEFLLLPSCRALLIDSRHAFSCLLNLQWPFAFTSTDNRVHFIHFNVTWGINVK